MHRLQRKIKTSTPTASGQKKSAIAKNEKHEVLQRILLFFVEGNAELQVVFCLTKVMEDEHLMRLFPLQKSQFC
jgi:hypothetical protein